MPQAGRRAKPRNRGPPTGGAGSTLGGILGFLPSLGYMLIAAMARVANLFELVSLRWVVAHIAAGCIGGLVVVFVGTAQRRRSEPDEVKAATAPLPIAPMLASLRSFDEHARDGVRRAIPLAILMFFLQRQGGRDAFWMFFAAYGVLLTPGKSPKSLGSIRVASAVFGISKQEPTVTINPIARRPIRNRTAKTVGGPT